MSIPGVSQEMWKLTWLFVVYNYCFKRFCMHTLKWHGNMWVRVSAISWGPSSFSALIIFHFLIVVWTSEDQHVFSLTSFGMLHRLTVFLQPCRFVISSFSFFQGAVRALCFFLNSKSLSRIRFNSRSALKPIFESTFI